MLRVHPVVHEFLPGGRFALRDFVFVMGERKVDATGVNVQRFAQIFHGHRGAFDMPAGAACPNRGLPEMFAGFWRFPQREIACAFFFVAIVVDASIHLHAAEIDLGEPAVILEFGDAVVDGAFAVVGIGVVL